MALQNVSILVMNVFNFSHPIFGIQQITDFPVLTTVKYMFVPGLLRVVLIKTKIRGETPLPQALPRIT